MMKNDERKRESARNYAVCRLASRIVRCAAAAAAEKRCDVTVSPGGAGLCHYLTSGITCRQVRVSVGASVQSRHPSFLALAAA